MSAAAALQIPFFGSDAQWDFITTTTKFTLMSGGYGAGKSHSLAVGCGLDCIENQGLTGMVVADTYGRLYRDFLPKLRKFFFDHGIPIAPVENQESGVKVKGWLVGPGWIDHTLLFGSMQVPAALKGPTLSHISLEEGTLIRRDIPGMEETTFAVLNSRLRSPTGTNRLRASGTPEGLENWTRDPGLFWVPPDEPERFADWQRDFRVITSSSFDNPVNPPGYVQSMINVMTPSQVKEKIYGIPAAGTAGAAYPDYDRNRNVRPVEFDLLRGCVIIGLDFNVNPMTASLMQDHGGCLLIFDEIELKHSTTRAMAHEIKRRLRALGVPLESVKVYPDASGRARKTSGESDFDVLREEGFRRLIYPKSGNPYVSERLNCVNALLFHGRILVSPRCHGTIRDFSRVARDKNGDLIKDREGLLTHLSDGIGYVATRRYPLRGLRGGVVRGRAA